MPEEFAGWVVFAACVALVWASGFMAGRLTSRAASDEAQQPADDCGCRAAILDNGCCDGCGRRVVASRDSQQEDRTDG